jgi:hypothetical protein
MAGLLDQKSRILDSIITEEGRRQILNGGMRIKFATFSDIGCQYQSDNSSLFLTSSISLNLESFSTSNDQLMVVTDDSGALIGAINRGQNISQFTAEDVAKTSVEFLKKQMIISTTDSTRNDEGLFLDPKNVTFSIVDGTPFDGEPSVSTITDVDSFFADKRLQNAENFSYLPPVQKSNIQGQGIIPLGNYANLSENNDVGDISFIDYLNSLEMKEINFSRLTEYNDIAIQFFETSSEKVTKLDIIKFGKIGISKEGSQSDLYFIGKIYFDELDVPTFVNIFTLVLE